MDADIQSCGSAAPPARSSPHHHSKNLRNGRFSTPLGLYFITKCTEQHYVLTKPQRTDIVQSFFHSQSKADWLMHAFVVMPDHWHVLVSLGVEKGLSRVMRDVCSYASCNSRRSGVPLPWQTGYHDHKLRPNETVVEMVNYIEANPVRKELVVSAGDWVWSSRNQDSKDQLKREFLGFERWE